MSKITSIKSTGDTIDEVYIAEVKASVNALYDSGQGIFKSYLATVTQAGTDAPVPTVLHNELGYVPSFGYGSVGVILILLEGIIDTTKMRVRIDPKSFSAKHLVAKYSFSGTNNTLLTIKTYDLLTAAYANDMLIDTPIEIMVYD